MEIGEIYIGLDEGKAEGKGQSEFPGPLLIPPIYGIASPP
jgi:hypothetical protein